MKKIIGLTLLGLSIMSSSVYADPIPSSKGILCDKMEIMLRELSDDHFTPRLVSQISIGDSGKLLTTVFVNPDKDMIVIETKIVQGIGISCVVSIGNDAQLFDSDGTPIGIESSEPKITPLLPPIQ